MTNLESLTPDAIDRLTANTEPWLSCDDCFELVDVVIEALVVSSTPFSEEFRVHLLRCPVCREEASSLAEIVAADLGFSPADAVAQIDTALSGVGA
ncbi:MAG: hypothetical protein ABI124_04625 [Terrimesophilobacter sp.]